MTVAESAPLVNSFLLSTVAKASGESGGARLPLTIAPSMYDMSEEVYELCNVSSSTDFFANGTSPIRGQSRLHQLAASYAFATVKRPMSTQKVSGLMRCPSARSKFVLLGR